MSVKLTVVVVTHNSAKWMGEFFRTWKASVARARLLKMAEVEVVVADCGSTDGTRGAVQGEGTFLGLENIGYGAAANWGVKASASSAKWILICNPDLTFPEEFVAKLIDPMLEEVHAGSPAWHGEGCVAPRLLNADGSVQASVGDFPTIGGLWRDQKLPAEKRKYRWPQPTGSCLVDWATGACLLVRRDKFEEVGGFDEKFFLYVEEVDLQRRLWEVNAQTWFAAEASVVHHAPNAGREPRAEVKRWAARGTLRYFAKHGTFGELMAYRAMAVLAGRLSVGEALRGRAEILKVSTGD